MKKTRSLLLFPLTFICLLSSCKKDDVEPRVARYSNNDAIAKYNHNDKKNLKYLEYLLAGKKSKSWVIYTYFVNGQDYTATVPGCYLDNILTFYKNRNYIQTEGETKCDPNSAETYDQGDWEFREGGSSVYLNAIRFKQNLNLKEISEDQIKVDFFDENLNAQIEFWLKPVSFSSKNI